MSMHLVRKLLDWASVVSEFEADHQVLLNNPKPPEQFPCLVAISPLPPHQCCITYVHDAIKLVKMAGFNIEPAFTLLPRTSGHQPPGDLMEGAGPPPSTAGAGAPWVEEEVAYKRHVSAMLMAIVKELDEIGAVSKSRFENTFTTMLAKVDQFHKEDVDKRYGTPQSAAEGVLQKLYPQP